MKHSVYWLACCSSLALWPSLASAQAIKPLEVEFDANGVDILSGKVAIRSPKLGIDASPHLKMTRLADLVPTLSGKVLGRTTDQQAYDINDGVVTSTHLDCVEGDCRDKKMTGANLVADTFSKTFTFYQGGTGASYFFDVVSGGQLPIGTGSGSMAEFVVLPSSASFPDGELLTYSYDEAAGAGGAKWYRVASVTSSFGYVLKVVYKAQSRSEAGWSVVESATIYAIDKQDTPLARLTYSGDSVIDLAGRVYGCWTCQNAVVTEPTTTVTSLKLPGEENDSFRTEAEARTYDGFSHQNWVTKVIADGRTWNYTYTAEGDYKQFISKVVVTGALGWSKTYNIDLTVKQRPRFKSIINSDNTTLALTYDNALRLEKVKYPSGNEVRVGRDDLGNIIIRTQTEALPTGVPSNYVRKTITELAAYTDDRQCMGPACFQPRWTRDAKGNQTDYTYDDYGQQLTRTDPADSDGRRAITISKYDGYRKTSERVCVVNVTCDTTAELKTEYTYWKQTLLVESKTVFDLAAGTSRTTLYGYDDAGRLTSVDGPRSGTDDAVYYRYDVLGRKTWEIGAKGSDGHRPTKRYTYRDADDKVTLTEEGWVKLPDSTTFNLLTRTVTGYDSGRNPTRQSTFAGSSAVPSSVTDASFDDLGRAKCTAVRMNAEEFTKAAKDACEQSTLGDAGPDRITRNNYDAAGQLERVERGVGTDLRQDYVKYEYTPNGKRKAVVDANGNRAEMSYDGFDRQVRWTFPSTTTAGQVNANDYEEYAYDDNGNRTSFRRRDGRTLTFGYDALNRMTSKIVPDGCAPIQVGACPTASATKDVYYGYDLRGLQTYARFDSTTGQGVSNTYTGYGELMASASNMGGTSRSLSYRYDTAGNLFRLRHSADVFFDYSWDALNRLQKVSDPAGEQIDIYTYNDAGKVKSHLDGALAYSYDGVGRLTGLVTGDPGNRGMANNVTLAYNPASQITQLTRSNDAYAFTAGVSVNRTYQVNGLNQYTSAGPRSFTHDANGNLTANNGDPSATDKEAYGYDAENRLVSASVTNSSGTTNTTLSYDPLGRLWQVEGAKGTTRFVYDGDQLVAEYDAAGNVLRRYVHGPGEDDPLIWYEGAGTAAANRRVLFADWQGSVTAVLTGDRSSVAYNAYDEYGIPNANNTGRFQYTGQAWLPELGLYYYKARIYSPTLGRFLQTDPIGYDDQINLYAYVANDPINNADPTGTECGTRIEGAIGAGCSGTSILNIMADREAKAAKAPQGQSAPGRGSRTDVSNNPHVMNRHVGRSDSFLKARLEAARYCLPGHLLCVGERRSGSFSSLNSANRLISATLSRNSERVGQVARGDVSSALVKSTFSTPTGREAFAVSDREAPIMRITYGVGVLIRHNENAPGGYEIWTAYPRND